MANLRADITIGQRGPAGPRGPQGPRGEQGPRGPQGANGANGDGTTTQLTLQTSENTINLNANVYYNLTLNNATETTLRLINGEAGLANEYLGQITVAADSLTFKIQGVHWLLGDNIKYTEGEDFNIIMNSGKTYLFSIVNDIGIMVVV